MKEEKKTFKEKWQDKKYQAKVKLSGYGIFVLIVVLMLSVGGGNVPEDNYNNLEDNPSNNVPEEENKKIEFNKPDVNNYTYETTISTKKDDIIKEYYYHGKVLDAYEEVVKEVEKNFNTYRIKDNKYYLYNNDKYVLTTEKEVYDILDYNYLNIDNINNYLSLSKVVDNKYQVYLKDIILDNVSEDYITITVEESSLNIDYTKLINTLENEEYNSYVVNIKYTV